MQKTTLAVTVVVLIAVLFFTVGCKSSGDGCPGCMSVEKSGTGWCDHCGKGMVDGKAVECHGCYTAMTGGPACPAHSK
jgi:hypothetical protein